MQLSPAGWLELAYSHPAGIYLNMFIPVSHWCRIAYVLRSLQHHFLLFISPPSSSCLRFSVPIFLFTCHRVTKQTEYSKTNLDTIILCKDSHKHLDILNQQSHFLTKNAPFHSELIKLPSAYVNRMFSYIPIELIWVLKEIKPYIIINIYIYYYNYLITIKALHI